MEVPDMDPITITLTAREVVHLSLMFELFRVLVGKMGLDVPMRIKEDIASILGKMVDQVSLQVTKEKGH